MVATPTQTVTIDRVSNNGNAIARQQHADKTIHVPAGEVGETLDVRLIDEGGYFLAEVVDRHEEVQPRQPGLSPDTSDIADDLLDPSSGSSHSFTVRSSTNGGLRSSSGQERRSRMTRRKK